MLLGEYLYFKDCREFFCRRYDYKIGSQRGLILHRKYRHRDNVNNSIVGDLGRNICGTCGKIFENESECLIHIKNGKYQCLVVVCL